MFQSLSVSIILLGLEDEEVAAVGVVTEGEDEEKDEDDEEEEGGLHQKQDVLGLTGYSSSLPSLATSDFSHSCCII